MSPILSDLDREPACSGDPCRHGQVACPIASACHAPERRERLGNPSRLMQALLDPYERAALTAGLALLGWVLLIAFGALRNA